MRRTAGGAVVTVLGAVATIMVMTILVLQVAAHRGSAAVTGGGAAAAPRTASQRTATDNRIYASGALPAVRCRLPRITQGADGTMRAFMNTLSGCLDTAWSRQFARAGMTFTPPNRMFWTQPGRGACGSYPAPGSAAYYCPVNNTMYVGLRDVVATSGNEPVGHYAVYARVIAHEYGHHVQQQSGILDYGHQLMSRSTGSGSAEASRRIELQAQCFAGAFLGAEGGTLPMTRAQYRAMLADARNRGDETQPVDRHDHGTGRDYAAWVVTGYQGRVLSVCDTWTAPASAVS